jgi:type I restriction enzyme S subunit
MSSKGAIATGEECGEKSALVPRLRFPEFRVADGWRKETLSGVAMVVMGSSPKSEGYNETKNGLPLIQGNADIKNRLSAPRVFTSEITKECQVGDILMSVRAPVGSVAKSIHHACIGRGIAAIHAKKPHAQELLYQWLLSYEPRWADISQGGTFDAINSDDLKQVGLTIPSPAEQQKVAECLSSLDELIAAETQKLDALKTHKKSLMQQLFPREGETVPRLRFPEFRKFGPWKSKTLSGIATIRAGTTPSRAEPAFYSGGTIPWVKTTDLNNGFIHHTEECITSAAKARINPVGSVLVAMYGGFNQIGRTGYLTVPAATNQAISVLNADENQVLPAYLLTWMNARVEDWKKIASSSRKDPNITGTDVANFPIAYPSKGEQRQIANALASLDDLITALSQKIDALKTHKQGLMQQLFPVLDEVRA